jgi:VWFA-related protein
MIKRCRRIFFLALASLAFMPGQHLTPTAQSQQGNTGEDEVVRITTNLVQVDAVVTDADGRIVTDLRQEDFEVLEDGRPQTIKNFSFVPVEPPAAPTVERARARTPKDENAPPAPPVRLRPEQVRNTMALVPGNLSFASTDAVHDALKKYVDEHVQQNDLVAVIPLFGSNGALHQFTTDKRLLSRAVERVRWLPSSGEDADSFEAERSGSMFRMTQVGTTAAFESEGTRATRERIESSVAGFCHREIRNLTALTNIVRSARFLPGRKSVVFFSDGLSIYRGEGDRALCIDNALRRLVDAAARSAVVIYAIDARGVVNQYHISAQDDVLPENSLRLRASRASGFFESQNGLNYMAENTGGRFIQSNNDLSQALARVIEDQRRSYYLIGYRPAEETFKGKRFHQLKVRVRRPGLKVRSRSGFYSLPDGEAATPGMRGGDRQLFTALAAPVGGNGVRVQLTPFFGNDPSAGSFVRTLLHINAQDLTFTDEPNGFKKAVLDVAAVTFADDGRIADEFNRTHTVRVGADTYRHVLLHGISYSADVPVKRAGDYQLRVVVRDAASGRLGASGQFVEVPDVRSKQFTLSGLVLGEAAPHGSPSLPPGASAEAALAPVPSAAHPALRHFRPGASLAYSYVIYNPPHTGRDSDPPQLTTRARLFREGRELLSKPETPFDARAQADPARLNATGTLALPRDAAPGSYVLQLVINDASSGKKRRTVTQWIDFEVVK